MKEIDKLNVDKLFILGDVVGYYYHSSCILKKLEKYNYECVLGNHEEMLLNSKESMEFLEILTKKYGSSFKRDLDGLSDYTFEYLKKLPFEINYNFDDLNVCFSHSIPWSRWAYVYEDTAVNESDIPDKYSSEHIFFIGHSHYQFIKNIGNRKIVNVGSVGQNRKKGAIAQWCLLDTENGNINLMSTRYDINELVLEVKKNDPEVEYLIKVLKR